MAYTRSYATWKGNGDTTTPITPASLQNIEDGIVAAYVAGAGGLTTADITDGTLINADINAAAAIAVTKLAPGTAGQVLGGTGPSYALPPGYEIGYTEFTAPVTSTIVAEASATQVVTSSAITYDGTAVEIEFFSYNVAVGTTGSVNLNLWDVNTDLGRIATLNITSGQVQQVILARRKLTPSAGSHTYRVMTWAVTATGSVNAGAGGAGTALPGFIRITKA